MSGLNAYYSSKVDELSSLLRSKRENLLRLTAQRNELNSKVRALKEELQLLQESGSSIGEVVKQMGKKKVLVKVSIYHHHHHHHTHIMYLPFNTAKTGWKVRSGCGEDSQDLRL